jgi:hypothetical protein
VQAIGKNRIGHWSGQKFCRENVLDFDCYVTGFGAVVTVLRDNGRHDDTSGISP